MAPTNLCSNPRCPPTHLNLRALPSQLDLDYDGSANDVLVDSGTTFTMMPTLVQQAVKAKLLQAMEAAGVKPKTNQVGGGGVRAGRGDTVRGALAGCA